MDCCPSEIILEISRWACLDGGPTGSALALVSRRVRHATALARYQSLALEKSRLRRFVAAIPTLIAAGALIQTRYLYFDPESVFYDIADRIVGDAESERLRSVEMAKKTADSIRVQSDNKEAAHELLKHVAPHLRVMEIQGNCVAIPFLSLPFTLPYLTSLTIPSLYGISIGPTVPVQHPFPRLHTLSLPFDPPSLPRLWSQLVLLAPSNSLRKLSLFARQLNDDCENVLQLLREQLGLPPADSGRTVPTHVQAQLSNLRQICFAADTMVTDLDKLRSIRSTDVQARGWISVYDERWLLLLDLEQDCANHHGMCGKFKILPRSKEIFGDYKTPKKRWLDEIAGRAGIWAAFE